MTIHYHGTPITPRDRLLELAGRHFCVSFAEPRDVLVCHRIGQSVMLDNGAYSVWRRGHDVDWHAWRAWVEEWLDYPTTWAVLPDSIDGGEYENDQLLRHFGSAGRTGQGVPVWHLHESLDRLRLLAERYGRVCFGSSGRYREVGSDEWHRRVSDAFDAIADGSGRVPWVHMLRGMKLSGGRYPFASVDSTNVARNHAPIPSRGKGRNDVRELADRWDGAQCPARWQRTGTQTTLEGVAP